MAQKKAKNARRKRRLKAPPAGSDPVLAKGPVASAQAKQSPLTTANVVLSSPGPGGPNAAPTLDGIDVARSQDPEVIPAPLPPGRGVLVVGMGDEARGDGGVGLHLMRCLSQLDWPESVSFCEADETVPQRAQGFAQVILLDAMEGPDTPGSLYEADPEDVMARSVGGPESGLGLLGMLPRRMLKRVSIFGVHPATTTWGAALSLEVISCVPMLMPYLRAFILKAATKVGQVN